VNVFLSTLKSEFLDLVFPVDCLLCREQPALHSHTPVCGTCLTQLTPTGSFDTCLRCAATVGPYTADETGCPLCRGVTYDFEEVVTLGRYQGLLAQTCVNAKKPRNHAIARLLTRMLFEKHRQRLRDWSADVIIPVPNYWWKRLRRENSAPIWIAHELGHLLKTPVRRRVVIQHKPSQDQHNIKDVLQRRRNVRHVYKAFPSKHIQDRTVLIVDDIMTSGETLHHVAKLLKANGARTVYAVAIARGQGKT